MKNHIIHEKVSFGTVRELLEWAAKKYEGKYAYSFLDSSTKSTKRVKFEEFASEVRALLCSPSA